MVSSWTKEYAVTVTKHGTMHPLNLNITDPPTVFLDFGHYSLVMVFSTKANLSRE